jgi:predicted porin
MSARVNGRLAMRAIDAEGVPGVIGSERRYGRLELGMDWALRPTWSFIASYAFAKARSDVTVGDPADSNAIRIGIRYHGRSATPGAFAQP